ncbi:SDR family NAD(P)-dependent oxidoreductase [Yinghuangia seranimata]|uniref:SDR family NAD(P)-dependent oxidoreductase n=1 Tax=Yinghuangia seranimata TaxID=408067 RepID=UPI00248B2D42|nr:SDR family NAD(P)-dependent oxidoreductase [Yinghuangia seranimata]MDI2126693.1 SDR family NAD(P)-dependent oxidoreductase [Yinghuangia seranimata]
MSDAQLVPQDATALVTGANSGLGLATVLELARHGVRAVGTVRSEEKAAKVRAAAEEAGVEVETRVLDVTDAAGCKDVVADVRPDILVNNAGSTCYAPVADVMEEEARHHLETAVFAPTRLARLALPLMQERGWGRVVQVSSVAGKVTYPLMGWYQAGKHAMEALSDAMRLEVAGSGVSVVVVAPGGFRSGISEDMADVAHRYRGSKYATAFRRLDLGFTLVQPFWSDVDEVARVIALAATEPSPRGRYVVGRDAQVSLLFSRLVENFAAAVEFRDRAVRRLIGMP